MKRIIVFFLATLCLSIIKAEDVKQGLKQSETLRYANLVNDYFMRTYPDVGAKSYVGGKERDSKIWTRGVYYEGLMAMYRQYPQENCLKYAEDWGKFHNWVSSGSGSAARHADFQCCGQAYLDMYMLKPDQTIRITHIKGRIEDMLATSTVDDWYWIDAIQMAMPIFAQLGSIEKDERYFKRMYEMYMHTRNKHGGSKKSGGAPLFNEEDGLWYRDYQYDPPYVDKTETDKPCYWSRGNGWVYAALARILYYSPETVYQRQQYLDDFILMSEALLKCQREDGFWGVSLAALSNTGHTDSPGPETSGTSLFVMGMAYGINEGILDREIYLPAVIKAWNALCSETVHESGFLGFVQGAGACPEDGQPVLFSKAADFEDFGIGCFLLAASEVYRLGDVDPGLSIVQNDLVQTSFNCYPLGDRISLRFDLEKRDYVSLEIYDLKGNLVRKVHQGELAADKYIFDVSTSELSGSGLYICVLRTSESKVSRKVVTVN